MAELGPGAASYPRDVGAAVVRALVDVLVFFFSSRRRHTRYWRDWRSDVCSSDLVEVRAQIWAETESQKGILIGEGGRMVREIGTAARRELERELGARVYLDLKVRVR